MLSILFSEREAEEQAERERLRKQWLREQDQIRSKSAYCCFIIMVVLIFFQKKDKWLKSIACGIILLREEDKCNCLFSSTCLIAS